MSVLPKLIYKHNPSKNTDKLFNGARQADTKVHMEKQIRKNFQENSGKDKLRDNKPYQMLKHTLKPL